MGGGGTASQQSAANGATTPSPNTPNHMQFGFGPGSNAGNSFPTLPGAAGGVQPTPAGGARVQQNPYEGAMRALFGGRGMPRFGGM